MEQLKQNPVVKKLLFIAAMLCFGKALAQPAFVGSSPQSFIICENSGAYDFSSLMSVTDTTTSEALTWAVSAVPSHGTLGGFPHTATSTGSTVTIGSGLTYTPYPGTSGSDLFKIAVTNGADTAYMTIDVTVNPLPVISPISGPSNVCIGSITSLSDATTGGTWSETNGNATIGTTGNITGITPGTDTIIYSIAAACTGYDSLVVSVLPWTAAGAITGPSMVCEGATITLIDATAGGNWSASNINATAGSLSGVVTGVTPGTDTITYIAAGTCQTATFSITIGALPIAGTITGAAALCPGSSITLTDTIPGGTWSARNAHATVDTTGLVTGVTAGRDTILYSVSNICGVTHAAKIITVNPVPHVDAITGIDSVCTGSTVALTDAVHGGRWYSSNTLCATVGSTGIVNGVVYGSSDISYVVSNACGSDTASVTVKVQLSALPIFGNTTLCQGTEDTLIDIILGGIWTSSNYLVAPVLPVLVGLVYGLTPGTATITYTLTNSCGTTTATVDVTVMSTAECTAGVATTQEANAAQLEIFPNPNNGSFTLNLVSPNDEPVSVRVTNIIGQQVYTFSTTTNKQEEIKLDSAPGIYFVSASTAGGKYMAKVNVVR